jgi:membrane peptidoglycan carboxypeptidase
MGAARTTLGSASRRRRCGACASWLALPPYPGSVTRQSSAPHPAIARLGEALVASVVTGLLLAAVAFPFVGGVGVAAKAAADEFLVLPAELKTAPLAQRSRVLAADGSLIAVLYRENRVVAPLQDIPEMTRKAVIATEDARFYAHNGVDFKGTARAAVENFRADQVTQGGSTLTQQYVKNALLQAASTRAGQDAAREDTIERKLKEVRYALAIEQELSKDEILERYLNIAYYGNGVYGMGTAAAFYFAKPVGDLTLEEGALLAGMVQRPGRFDPVKALADPAIMERLIDRRNIVLRRMEAVGFIDEAQLAASTAVVPTFNIQPIQSGCENPRVAAPFFCEHVRNVLERTAVGSRSARPCRSARTGCWPAGSRSAPRWTRPCSAPCRPPPTSRSRARTPSRPPRRSTASSRAPATIKAMAVNRYYSEQELPGHSKVNLATGGSSGMQAGSTFKPFVLTTALQQGIPLGPGHLLAQPLRVRGLLDYDDEGTRCRTA